MHVLSVNIGAERAIRAKSGTSGIYKEAQAGPVPITFAGVANDVIVDVQNHGGVDQAVYVYGWPDYEWWSQEIDKPLAAGYFGENLTLSDLESATLCIGDRFHMGEVVLEVTSPRVPCVTLAVRMKDPRFVRRFVKARRYGAYCRVIRQGMVQAGDDVALIPYEGDRITINEVADSFFARTLKAAQLRRLLAVPVSIRDRVYYEDKLAELNAL